jgi:hypothetical protein
MSVEVAVEVLRARGKLGVLDDVRVAAPCAVGWDRMTGDERVRRCGECKLDVYNLSGMTREEAEALITGRIDRLCVRFYRRSDGTILTADCPVGSARQQRRRLVAATAAGGLALGAAALWGATPDPEQLEHHEATQGMLIMPGPNDDPPHKRIVPTGETQPTEAPATETVIPDADTRAEMAARHITQLRGRWQLCLDDSGAVTDAIKLEGTGVDPYDVLIDSTVRRWRYPARDGRQCFELTFVYTQPPS